MNEFIDKYRNMAAESNITGVTRESMRWYKNVIAQQKGNLPITKIKAGYKQVSKLRIGMMVTYTYRAKHAADLPYWDQYPLVYVLEITKTGWTGINVHYLHPRDRLRLFSRDLFNGEPLENDISRPAMKRYLAKQVVRKPVEIPSEDWQIMIHLPFEKFVGSTKTKVWADTRNKR